MIPDQPTPSAELDGPVYRCVDCGRMLEDSHTPTCPWDDPPARPFPRIERIAPGTNPVDTDALDAAWHKYAALNGIHPHSIDRDTFEQGWDAAADEVDRLRAQHNRAIEQFNDVCERSDAKTHEINRLRADNEHLEAERASVKAQRDHIIGQYQALRAAVENAPHADDCFAGEWIEEVGPAACTCWKADVL